MNFTPTTPVIAALLICISACGESELTAQDYACDVADDCAILSVPTCCGNSSESTPECLNEGAAVPDDVDCDDNEECAGTLAISRCDCVENDLFEGKDAPAKICVGLP